jgi:predicted dehydrogenase
VLCEKPVAPTLAGMDEIEAAARESGRVFSGVFQLRFGRGAQQVRRLIDEGAFGRLHLGLAETLWLREGAYYDDVPWHGTWSTECGGVTVSQAIHVIDALLWFMGEPERVYAEAGTFRARMEAEDTSVAVVRFKSGAIGQITSTISSLAEQKSLLQLHGTELTATSQDDEYSCTRQPFVLSATDPERAARLQREQDERLPKGYRLLHRGVVGDFLDAIEHRREPLVGVEACRTALQVTTAIYKSAMTGERVDLPIAKDDPFYGAIPPEGFALPS